MELIHNRSIGRTHHWIGINPPPNKYTLKTLANAMQEASAKFKLFEPGSFTYTLEQNTLNGVRPHIHLFLVSTTRPSRIIDILARFFKVQKNSIDIKTYRKDILWDEHLSYINGDKKSEKMEFVTADNLDKFNLDIQQTYGNII